MKNKNKHKKAASHVGVILSFVIFITFLTFMFSIIEPSLRVNRDKEALLEYMSLEVREEIKTNLSYELIKILKPKGNLDCLSLPRNTDKVGQDSFIKEVKSGEGEISLDSYDAGTKVNMFRPSSVSDSWIIKVYYSEESFLTPSKTCKTIKELKSGDYSLVSQKEGEEIFLSKVNDFIEEYNTGYDTLKQRLNVPVGSDFSMVFEDKDGKIVEASIEKSSDNIYSDKAPIQYVDEQANLNPGFITISVW